ncbi:hypothetical protein [Amycolatopsis sp. NPDC004378]
MADVIGEQRGRDDRRAAAADTLGEAADELERAATTLRQALADGSAPPGVQELIDRLDRAAARARARTGSGAEGLGHGLLDDQPRA